MTSSANKPDKRKFASLRKYPKTKFSKGTFVPTNPKKYRGDVNKIIYRSSWERNFMKKLDINDGVIQWSSEELIIPYKHPADGKIHRYFPDFWIKSRSKTGDNIWVIEIKPASQATEPKKQNRRTKRYLTEVMTFAINKCKWEAAEEYCKLRGWKFKVLTEAELGVF